MNEPNDYNRPPAAAIAGEPSVPAFGEGARDDTAGSPSDPMESAPEPVTQRTDAGAPPASSVPQAVSLGELEKRLMTLQQEIRKAGIPVVIVFEGWGAAGKGTMLGELLEGLDPRGYTVYACGSPSEDEKRFPLSRRFWVRMPSAGNISLFVGSWYGAVSHVELIDKPVSRRHLEEQYAQIVQMESQLIASGALLIKFFLNIPKKEQKKRLKALESKKSTRWRVSGEDWAQNGHYDEMMQLFDAMMARTHFDGALWHVLRAEDKNACKRQMYDVVLDAFEKAVADRREGGRPWDTPTLSRVSPILPEAIRSLNAVDPFQALAEEYRPAMSLAQKRLRSLHNELYRKKVPLILCFEGWDASGKGGSILRLTSALDPRGFEVVPICAPTPEEKAHHHLWRFWKALPKDGHIAIFDRTWYGRVMVERVEGFCTEPEWRRAYEEINQFEHELSVHGAVIRKFWLHISPEEQLKRFASRQSIPEKQWKITDEDWRNREKWPQYEIAADDMLERTHTLEAPWVIVEANNKPYARLKILQEVVAAMEEAVDR